MPALSAIIDNVKDLSEFRKQIIDCIENNTGAIFKSFIPEEIVPKWEDLLVCIYNETKENIKFTPSKHEKAYGNVLLSDNIYIVSHLSKEQSNRYFSKLNRYCDEVGQISGVSLECIGPKISLGPQKVDFFHIDSWHAFGLQCEGEAKWTLSDTQDGSGQYLEEFCPSRGDLLFFPQGMWHKVETNENIRGGIQFSSVGIFK
jgi:hypothetical protein